LFILPALIYLIYSFQKRDSDEVPGRTNPAEEG